MAVELADVPEAVRDFLRDLPDEPSGTILSLHDRPVYWVMPATDEWNDELNRRRFELIDRDVEGLLSPTEQTELEDLQDRMLAFRQRVAPLPLGHARRLLERLERMPPVQS